MGIKRGAKEFVESCQAKTMEFGAAGSLQVIYNVNSQKGKELYMKDSRLLGLLRR